MDKEFGTKVPRMSGIPMSPLQKCFIYPIPNRKIRFENFLHEKSVAFQHDTHFNHKS